MTKTATALDGQEDVESMNWQLSDDDGDSDLVSEGEDFMLDLENENIDGTNKSSECTVHSHRVTCYYTVLVTSYCEGFAILSAPTLQLF